LFDSVFTGPILECLRKSLDYAQNEHTMLRIRLRLSDCPELAHLPWEMLYEPSDDWFLSLSPNTPVIRYVQLKDPPRSLHVTLPLNVLFIRSQPTDFPVLNLEEEWAQVATALHDLSEVGAIAFTELVSPTLGDLRRTLMRDSFHVLHYTGPGAFDEDKGGVLLFADRSGRGLPVTAQDLGVLLRDHISMRLAIINTGEGARTDPAGHVAGLAETLVRRGIPAVVAMQFQITDTAAVEFAPALYGALAAGLPIDAAVGEARKAVFVVSSLEFATPVLYMRAAEGQLFDIAPASYPLLSRAPSIGTSGSAQPSVLVGERPAQAQDDDHESSRAEYARPPGFHEEIKPKVFVSYSHKDERYLTQLTTHLAILRNEGTIADWNDRKIMPGDEWRQEIDDNLDAADCVLLLVTPDFLASDYCYSIELQRALEKHREGLVLVIPVIVRPADWRHTPLRELQALPKDAKPVIEWASRDRAWLNVAEGVRLALAHS
jgi:hypothetical protein